MPDGITPYEAMFGRRPNVSNMHVFGCHAELLIEKQYRRKELTSPTSESAIFLGYCRQSTGYIFYIPDKHVVVSRRDAHFNDAYFPARVGETTLIDTSKAIRFEEFPDGNMALPDGKPQPDRALPDGSSQTSQNDPKSILNHSKSTPNHSKSPETDVLTSKTHSNMPKSTSNGDLDPKTGVLAPKSLSLDAKTSPKSSPDIEVPLGPTGH